MEEVLIQGGEEAARLARQVVDALTAARFEEAASANTALSALTLPPALQLFTAYARIRLAAYQAQPLDTFAVLEQVEQPYSTLNPPGVPEKQWYLLSWLTLPFTCSYPIDVFYLHHRALELPQLVMRQRCLARAVRYGVEFKDHPYMAFVLEHRCAQLPSSGDPYYSGTVQFLTAAYQRRVSELPAVADNLRRTASSPLQAYSANELVARFSHLWES